MTTFDSYFSDTAAAGPPKDPDRDQWGRRIITMPDGKREAFTAATTISKTLEYTGGVDDWNSRIVVHGVAQSASLTARAQLTPVSDKRAYEEIVGQAKILGGGTEKADWGNATHELLRYVVTHGTWPQADVEPRLRHAIQMMLDELQRLGIQLIPEYFERRVINRQSGSSGILDGIAVLADGRVVVVDVKTGSLRYQPKPTAVQVAQYSRADIMMAPDGVTAGPMTAVDQEIGLLLHIDIETGQPTVEELDLVGGWYGVTLANRVRAWRRRDDLSWPHVPHGRADRSGPPADEAPTSDVTAETNIAVHLPATAPTWQPGQPVIPDPVGAAASGAMVTGEELFELLPKAKAKTLSQTIARELGAPEIRLNQYSVNVCKDIVAHPAWPGVAPAKLAELRKDAERRAARAAAKAEPNAASPTVPAEQLSPTAQAVQANVAAIQNGAVSPQLATVTPIDGLIPPPADLKPWDNLRPAPPYGENELIAMALCAESNADLGAIWRVAVGQVGPGSLEGWSLGLINVATQRQKTFNQ